MKGTLIGTVIESALIWYAFSIGNSLAGQYGIACLMWTIVVLLHEIKEENYDWI